MISTSYKFDKNQHQIVVTSLLQNLEKMWQTIRWLAKEMKGHAQKYMLILSRKHLSMKVILEFDEIMISRYIKLDHIMLSIELVISGYVISDSDLLKD